MWVTTTLKDGQKMRKFKKNLEKINAAATPNNKAVVEFVSKSGQDGSNTDTEYKKPGDDREIMDDSKMFGSSFTAINLTHVKEDYSVKS